jgi:hypothetical protein
VRTNSIKPLSHVAVATQQLKIFREVVLDNPSVKRRPNSISDGAAMLSTVVIDMVDVQELRFCLATADTPTSIMFEDGFAYLLQLCVLSGALFFSMGFVVFS